MTRLKSLTSHPHLSSAPCISGTSRLPPVAHLPGGGNDHGLTTAPSHLSRLPPGRGMGGPVSTRNTSRPVRKSAVACKPDPESMALSIPEVAFECRCSVNTIWNLLRDRRLTSFTVNRRRLITRASLAAFMASGETGGSESVGNDPATGQTR